MVGLAGAEPFLTAAVAKDVLFRQFNTAIL
jgi:hypothetical protein